MSEWILVEAVKVDDVDETPTSPGPTIVGSGSTSSKKKKRSRTARRLAAQSLEEALYQSQLTAQVIEGLLSCDYLVQDTFLRKQMDREGWIPLDFLLSYYPAVSLSFSQGATHEGVIQHIASFADVDTSNFLFRVKDRWERWLVPNGMGGFGLPFLWAEQGYIVEDGDECMP